MFKKKDKIINIIKKLQNIHPKFIYISLVIFVIFSFLIEGFKEFKFIIILLLLIISILVYFNNKKGFVKDFTLIIFFAFTFRSLILEPFHIPSSSMKPNLLIHDYIIVSKMSYGYGRYSLPFGLDLFSDRIFGSLPERGDVAVFRKPTNTNINYIKRIIGLPGDEIQIINGQILINNIKIPKEEYGYFKNINKFGEEIAPQFLEILPNNKKIKVLDYANSNMDNTQKYLVPKGHYFVMGDNRDNSEDSRFLSSVGFIPYENLIGEAKIIFFSAKYPFLQFWKWPFNIRFDRIFKIIK
jgi:signal peptidase I